MANKILQNVRTIAEVIGVFVTMSITILNQQWSAEMKLAVMDFILIVFTFGFFLTYKPSRPRSRSPRHKTRKSKK